MAHSRLLASAVVATLGLVVPSILWAQPVVPPQKSAQNAVQFSGTWLMTAEGDADDYWIYLVRPGGRSQDFNLDEEDINVEIVETGAWTLRIGIESNPDDCGPVVVCDPAFVVSIEERQPNVFYVLVRRPTESGVEATFIFRPGCGTLMPPLQQAIPTFQCTFSDVCLFTWGEVASCTGIPLVSYTPPVSVGAISPGIPHQSSFIARKTVWHVSDTAPSFPLCEVFQGPIVPGSGAANDFSLNRNRACGGLGKVTGSLQGQSGGLRELKAYAAVNSNGYPKAVVDATSLVADDGQVVHTMAGAADLLFFRRDTALPDELLPHVARFNYTVHGDVTKTSSDAIAAGGSFIRGAGRFCERNGSPCSADFGHWRGPAETTRNETFSFEFKTGADLLVAMELVAAASAVSDRASSAARFSAAVAANFDATATLVGIQLFEGTIANPGPEVHDFTIESRSGEDYNQFVGAPAGPAVYAYQGAAFTFCGYGCPEDSPINWQQERVIASLTFDAPLPPNLPPTDILSSPGAPKLIAWTIGDALGFFHFSSAAGDTLTGLPEDGVPPLVLSTNASGDILNYVMSTVVRGSQVAITNPPFPCPECGSDIAAIAAVNIDNDEREWDAGTATPGQWTSLATVPPAPPYQISGEVVDANGTPVTGVTVTLTGPGGSSVLTGQDGTYLFTNLAAGNYTVVPALAGDTFAPLSRVFPNLANSKSGSANRFVVDVATFTRYFAEGATNSFFDTSLALLNATARTAHITLEMLRSDGGVISHTVTLGPRRRATVNPKTRPGLSDAAFSTVVTSDVPVIVDRTMRWDSRGYGSHAETSIAAPATTWYLAEGATHSGFDLFYLLQNATDTNALVEITYLRPAPAPPVGQAIHRGAAQPRSTSGSISEGDELSATDVSAIVTVTNNVPIIVERAMYLDDPASRSAPATPAPASPRRRRNGSWPKAPPAPSSTSSC